MPSVKNKPLFSVSAIFLVMPVFCVLFLFGCAGQPTGTLDKTDKIITSTMSTEERNRLMRTMREGGKNVKVDVQFKTNLERLPTSDVRELCDQYCKDENFSKCRSCLDTYLGRDDIRLVLGRSCRNPGQIAPKSIGADFLHVIDFYEKRARTAIFFADFAKAQSNIDIYAEILAELEKCELPKQSRLYTNGAEIYALIGNRTGLATRNRTKIDQYLAVAHELAQQSDERESKIISEVNESTILVHMATQNYQQALDILVDPQDYLNRTFGQRTGESLENRAGTIAGLAGLAGVVGVLAGLSYEDTALAMGAVAAGGVLVTMLEEAAADIEDLPYRNFQIAKCKYELGLYEEAKDRYEKLLVSSKDEEDQVNLEVVYTDLGNLYYKQKDYTNAAKYLKMAVSLIERYRSTLNSDADKIGFIKEDRHKIYIDLVDSLMQTGAVEEALEYAERAKSRALVDLLATKQEFGSDSKQDDYSLIVQQQHMAEEMMAKDERSSGSGTRSFVKNTEHISKTKQKNPELASLVAVNSLKFSTLKSYLAKDETMLEYYGEGSTLYAFIVTPKNIHMEKLDTGGLDELIREYSKNISRDNPVFSLDHARAFHEILIKPLTRHLEYTKKLTIIPHGSLHSLPFNAFLDNANSYLIEKYSIRMLPSASVMEFLQESTSRNGHMLILSNPYIEDYEPDQAPIFGTLKEGVTLTRLFKNARHLTGKDAKKNLLTEYGSVPAILHIASHAEFKENEPLLSRLLLAGDGTEDGSLTVNDLYHLDLNNYLVTLSACETGLGENKNGDNIIGLIRGFFFAGAESIVSTLWKIDDENSTTIMVDFYKNLATYNKQEALRQAQLSFLNNVTSDPYYWASFQITGAAGLPPEKVSVLDDKGLSLNTAEKKQLEGYKQLKREMTLPTAFESGYSTEQTYAMQNQAIVRSGTRSVKARRRKPASLDTKQKSQIPVKERKKYSAAASHPGNDSKGQQSWQQAKVSPRENSLIDYDVKILMGEDENRATSFLETVEKIPIKVYLGSDSPYSFISLIVSDKGRGILVNEIPMLVDAGSDYAASTLKRPMQGWTKGIYEVVVKDKNGTIISRKEFTITD